MGVAGKRRGDGKPGVPLPADDDADGADPRALESENSSQSSLEESDQGEDTEEAVSRSEDSDSEVVEGDETGSDVASDEEEASGNDSEDGDDITEAMVDYVGALEKDRVKRLAGNGSVSRGSDDEERDASPLHRADESDSSEDELPPRNTVGSVPLEWYKNEEHIGYDASGKKIKKREKKDQLDSFLARSDDPGTWRKVYDEYNDEEVELTKDEINLIKRLREGKLPHAEVNPYEPYVDWFDWKDKGHPLSSAPEPKRRFIPSKWEAKKVVKLVRAIRKGWIKLEKPKEKPKYYLMWGDDLKTAEKTANGLSYIPAPKTKLPGHEESYNPPVEYIPSQEEVNSYALMYEEDRPKFIPKRFESLRQVPTYSDYIKERFERCLDLYLCPRTQKKRINIDPESLVPKLPKSKDLQPFPIICYLEFCGHTGPVITLAVDPSGMWLASGSSDGTVRLWEVETARCCKVWNMNGSIRHLSWNPNSELYMLGIAMQHEVVLLDTNLSYDFEETSRLLTFNSQTASSETSGDAALVTWSRHDSLPALVLKHNHEVVSISWHHKGDYFTSVTPDANTRAVLVHQLSKQQTQNPFRKLHGRVVRVLFHPTKPFLFVATKMHVRVYNLTKQQLSKKLLTGVHEITSMDIHPKGDNLIIGSREGKLCWFDMDLSMKPYKTLKNHHEDIQAVTFHQSYPLFASCADDSTAHVFHGMVYSDLLQNPLIVPLKILRGHKKVDGRGIMDCQFHVKQPWLFTAGADGVIKLFSN